jgi:hypothetical protein
MKRELIEKFIKIDKEIWQEKDTLYLFGLFLRQDAPNKWDLVISAKWLSDNIRVDVNYIVNKIRKYIPKEEGVILSRIVLLKKDNKLVSNINMAFDIKNNAAECKDCVFNNILIKHAYVITSKKNG